MSDDLRKQIYDNLDLKETEELLEIWKDNNRGAWTEEAFQVIQKILLERLGEIPVQGQPIEYIEGESGDNELINESDDLENAPVFYEPSEVQRLVKWINVAAIVAVIAVFISGLFELPSMQRIVLSYFGVVKNDINFIILAWIVAIIAYPFFALITCIFIYFPLKALGLILKILMVMEFESRGAEVDII